MTETRLDVVIGSSGAVTGASAVNRAIDQVKSNFIDLSAKVFVAERAMARAWNSAKRGAEAEETMARLDQQMRRLGSSANVMVSVMQRVTQGQLSMANSAQLASRALAIGLSPSQIAVFAEAAEGLADRMGTDIPQAFDQLVSATATGSNRALAQMGIFFDLEEEMRKLAVSTGRTTEQITKQERAMLGAKAVAQSLQEEHNGLVSGMVSDADKLTAYEARWNDFWDTAGMKMKTWILELVELNHKLQQSLRSVFNFIAPGFFPEPQVTPEGGAAGAGPLPTRGLKGQDALTGLPFSLRSQQLQGARDRDLALARGLFARDQIAEQAMAQLQDLNVQRRLQTEEQAVEAKARLRERLLNQETAVLREQLRLEENLYRQTIGLAGITTEDKIKLEVEYVGKVTEINQQLLGLDTQRASNTVLVEGQRALARQQAAERIRDNELSISSEIYQMEERNRSRALEGWELYYRGQIDLAEANFASDQEIAAKEQALLREQLAFKLRLTRDEIEQILQLRRQGNTVVAGAILGRGDPLLSPTAREGILASGEAQDIRLNERRDGGFFSGWARGMQDYTRRTNSAFNMANDMARRTAQNMESSFQQLFFDPMKEGWSGFLDGLLNMTRQIMSQVAAQIVTSGILRLMTSFAGGIGGGGGSFSSFFALAGSRNVANGLPARATGGVDNWGTGTSVIMHGWEAAVPLPDGRSIPVTMRLPGGGSPGGAQVMPVTVNVINQAGADVQATPAMNNNGNMELEILVTKSVNRSFSEGRMDRVMRSRYGLTPGER